uniref:Uncharacterized protein n=1 Tax=Trichuris muris TaxID=70415 RepID=A0A5S6QS13_TRIMR
MSKDTVQRQIDEMAMDVEEALCDLLRRTEFVLQLDESTLPGNEALLLAYVHFIKDEQLTQEFLFARELSTDTKEHDCSCYRWSAVHGRLLSWFRFVPERRSLSSPRLHESLQLFRQLCDEKDEEYNRLLLHTEVRWLSRDEDVALRDMLELRQADIAYLADLYEKFNAMNLQLQLALYKRNISRGELCPFPKLAELKRCPDPCDQDIEVYSEHLEMLHEELKRRFHDVFTMVVPNWEELVELQSNDELKPRLRQGYAAFSQQKQIPILYPRLCVVTELLTKKRNRLHVVN